MCDAVPSCDANACFGRGTGGKLLPLIGNAPPRRAPRREHSR